MLRGHAHATFTALILHDSLVQLQTKILAFFIITPPLLTSGTTRN
jgi:hypothetical protein